MKANYNTGSNLIGSLFFISNFKLFNPAVEGITEGEFPEESDKR